jgi:hypothetical protein
MRRKRRDQDNHETITLKTTSPIQTFENIFVGEIMQSILKLFSDHGTFVLPDALTYISSKEKPDDFAAFLIKNLREYPLFLALDAIKDIEASTQQLVETPITPPEAPQNPVPSVPAVEKTIEKEFQKKMLLKIYNKPSFPKEINEEEDEEDTEEEQPQQEEKKPLQPLDLKTVKSWKPLAKDYNSEVRIINDITGKRTSEGTTQDLSIY